MSPDKLIYQANQIARFFHSKPHAEGVTGVAEHINKFWEPRIRRQFFDLIKAGDTRFDPMVVEAAPKVRQPPEAA
jgi:formate dehydrogenase subunit delta